MDLYIDASDFQDIMAVIHLNTKLVKETNSYRIFSLKAACRMIRM